MAMVCGLLVGVGKLDQRWFAPRTTEDRHARGKRATGVAHRDVDRRPPRRRRKDLTIVAVRRVHVANETGRIAPRWVDERVEPVGVHRLCDSGAKLVAV